MTAVCGQWNSYLNVIEEMGEGKKHGPAPLVIWIRPADLMVFSTAREVILAVPVGTEFVPYVHLDSPVRFERNVSGSEGKRKWKFTSMCEMR